MWWIFGGLAALLLTQKQTIVDKVDEMTDAWTRFDDLFKKYGAQYAVDWKWLKAIALNESDLGREKSVARGLGFPSDIEGSKSRDGLSWGLMQVTVRTAREMDPTATAEKLNNPEYSVKLAAQYISSLGRFFNLGDAQRTEWIIKSYNQGPGNSLKEKRGEIDGYAEEYWERFQRNINRVEESL